MFEVTILIPSFDNLGVAFTDAHDAVFEAYAMSLFTGFSWRGTVPGGWIGENGVIYRDVSRGFVLALRSLAEAEYACRIAMEAKQHYRQEAVYMFYLGLAEII